MARRQPNGANTTNSNQVDTIDFSIASELPISTHEFYIQDKPYEVNSLQESIIDLSTGEVFPTLQPLLQHLAPDLYGSYTFNGNFPENFYRFGDATRVRVIRRLQYLHDRPPETELVRELTPLIKWMAEHTQNSQTVSRSFWRAMYGTDNNEIEATALILYYGIFSSHNAHGKAVPGFNYHTIEETTDSIIIKSQISSMKSRFRNVQHVGLTELDNINRANRRRPADVVKKIAFREFYSGTRNNGLWITQTPEIHQYLQKLIQDIIKAPREKLPDYEPPESSFAEIFECVIPKESLEKRKYYRPSGYESIPLEPERIYTSKELQELGITKQNISKATQKGYLINTDRGKYKLNPEFKGGK